MIFKCVAAFVGGFDKGTWLARDKGFFNFDVAGVFEFGEMRAKIAIC